MIQLLEQPEFLTGSPMILIFLLVFGINFLLGFPIAIFIIKFKHAQAVVFTRFIVVVNSINYYP